MAMGKRASGAASSYSRRVSEAVKLVRARSGLSNADLIREAGFSTNYFYVRLRGEAPFDTNDLDRIARALNIEVEDITHTASSLNSENADLALDGRELARRLTYLSNPVERSVTVVPIDETLWDGLRSATGRVKVPLEVLTTLAAYFEVDVLYLTDFGQIDIAERIEAELDLSRALSSKGATPVATRALGALSPSAMRAVAESIRSIERGDL